MVDNDATRVLFLVPPKKKTDTPRLASTGSRIEIGTALECALVLDDPLVADVHCSIELTGGSFHLSDEGSPTGTYCNGLPVTEPVELAAGDEIVLGCSRIAIKATEQEAEPQLSLALEERRFHFVEKGKGGELADLYEWARSEVGFGRSRPLAWANVAAAGVSIALLVLMFLPFAREPLADPGALHPVHARLFADPDAWQAAFPAEVAVAREEGCAACHAPFGNTPLDRCANCHADLMQNQHPFQVEPVALAAGVEGNWQEQACVQCHLDHPGREGWPLVPPSEGSSGSCGVCHEEGREPSRPPVEVARDRSVAITYDAFPHSVHLDSEHPIACEACHVAAPREPGVVVDRTAHDFTDVTYEVCVGCHAAERVERIAELEEHWAGEALFDVIWHGTDDGGASCKRCHEQVYDAPLARETQAVAREVQFELADYYAHEEFFAGHPDFRGESDLQSCEECHFDGNEISATRQTGRFWHGLHMVALEPSADAQDPRAGSMALSTGAQGCTTCHTEISSSDTLAGNDWRDTEGNCSECHAEGSLAVASVHAVDQLRPRFPHDVHVAAFGGEHESLADGCFACHDFEPGNVWSEVRTDPRIGESCADCHTGHAAVGGGDCQACHAADDIVWRNEALERPDWPAPNAFDHASPGHEGVACLECHIGTQMAERVQDVPIPTEADSSCRECHQERGARFHWR